MSSSATIVEDWERDDCRQQPLTGGHRRTRRRLNSSSPSADGNPGEAATAPRRQRTPLTSTVDPGTFEGNTRRGRQRREPPVAAVEPSTGADNTRRRTQRRSDYIAELALLLGPPVEAVEPVTGAETVRHTRQMRTRPAAAVQPGTRERANNPDTELLYNLGYHLSGDEGSSTNEDNNRPKHERISVFEQDLTPAERAIPDTGLLHNLGYHLSAYARVGRGPPTQNLNCRGAWHTAVKLYREAHDQYKELFIAAGFGDFLKIEPVDVPVAYNLALMERWFSETNTLHLPCCEIGPTPVDWTMVTGLSFGGRRIKANSDFKMERALDLLGKPGAKKDGKILLSGIKPASEEVRARPPNDEVRDKVFRRLFLYVVGSCFFNNNRAAVSHKLVKCVERINEVRSYDWGGITFATFLAGMRRKVTAEIGAFTAFWQFLPFWAFEYLDVYRPKHTGMDVFPRASGWICPKSFSDNESPKFIGPRFIAYRCQLDYVEESQLTWQPYLASAKYRSDAMKSTIDLAKMRIPFQSIDTWEYYLGERCRRQLGFPCQVPNDPPEMMHGTRKGQRKPIYTTGTSAESFVKEGLEYTSWFATNSIGRIVDVNRFLGGPDVAGNVLEQWMAKHQPDLIVVNQSQYEKLKEDRNALEKECAQLREELYGQEFLLYNISLKLKEKSCAMFKHISEQVSLNRAYIGAATDRKWVRSSPDKVSRDSTQARPLTSATMLPEV